MRNFYKVLDVSEKASKAEIRTAYLRLVKTWHPDRNPHTPLSDGMMKMYNEAYGVLSDPVSKSNYDLLLRNHQDSAEHVASEPQTNEYQPRQTNEYRRPHHTNEYQSSRTYDISDAWWNRPAYTFSDFSLKKTLGIFFILFGGLCPLLLYTMDITPVNTAEGRIVNSKLSYTDPLRGPFLATVYYEYTVDGTTYNDSDELDGYYGMRGAREKLTSYLDENKDKPIIVYYDPDQPKRSVLRSPNETKFFSKRILVYGVILSVFGLVCFFDLSDIARLLDIIKYTKKRLSSFP